MQDASRRSWVIGQRASVLDCASPLPLFPPLKYSSGGGAQLCEPQPRPNFARRFILFLGLCSSQTIRIFIRRWRWFSQISELNLRSSATSADAFRWLFVRCIIPIISHLPDWRSRCGSQTRAPSAKASFFQPLISAHPRSSGGKFISAD